MARLPNTKRAPASCPAPIGRRRSNAGPRGAYADLLLRVHEIFGPLPVIDGAEREQISSMRCVKSINPSLSISLPPLLEKGPPVLPPLKMLWSCYFWTCCACYGANQHEECRSRRSR